MKRILVILSLLLVLLVPSFANSQPVNPKIKRPFVSSVSITDRNGNIFGSGVIIERNCKVQVLTASHVISYMQKKKKKIHMVTTFYIGVIPLKLIKQNKDYDLALLGSTKHIKAAGVFVRLATSSPFIGDTVWMISSPGGRAAVVTRGILSNFMLHKRKGRNKTIILFGTTASGFFASSGGGLFNDNGDLIGIFHMIVSSKLGVLPGGHYSVSLPYLVKFLK